MAALGNIGVTFNRGNVFSPSRFYMQDKEPTSVTMANTASHSAFPGGFAILTRNATFQDKCYIDGSGVWHFYDMDDSGGQVYGISTYTQGGPTGEDWQATVVGNVVVVTQLHAANRAVAMAYC